MKSIKFKITLWYVVLMLILVSVTFVLLHILSWQLTKDSVENKLKIKVTQVAEDLKIGNFQEELNRIENRRELKNISVYDAEGNYLAGQPSFDLQQISFKDKLIRHKTLEGEEYLIYDLFKKVGGPNSRVGYWIRGSESLNSLNVFNNSTFKLMFGIIPALLLLTIMGGYYITKKAFLPVNEIIKTADEIYWKNDLSQRIPSKPQAAKDELQLLTVTLNRMLDKIEQLINREKQFTSDASHELRTPLSVILAQSEYLLELASTDKEQELAVSLVLKAQQMSELLAKLLFLSRMDSDRQEFKRELIDLNELIDVAVEEIKPFAVQRNITINTHILANPPMEADESLLLTALRNLLSNAVKYGREAGTIQITLDKVPEGAELIIADDGTGIAPEDLPKIWERFYRVDKVRNDEGSGLGLALVKSIVKLHRGSISVTSNWGQGTSFKIFLPLT